jgi:paraquat-inducible protein A
MNLQPSRPDAASPLLACHECDLLQAAPANNAQGELLPLWLPVIAWTCLSAQYSLALVLAGLLMFVLANAFPVVGLEANGVGRLPPCWDGPAAVTAADGASGLLLSADRGVDAGAGAALPAVFTVTAITCHAPRGFARVMRLCIVASLGHGEVFLLRAGMVKLRSHMAEVHPGIGLWSFFALIMLLAGNASRFDPGMLGSAIMPSRPRLKSAASQGRGLHA